MTSSNSEFDALFAISQSQGTRPYQEDEAGYQARSDSDLLPSIIVLADGMGGHAGGKQASNLAVRVFLDAYANATAPSIHEKLHTALLKANDAIADATAADPELSGMGCTLIGGAISDDGFEWISVGDSPLFKLGASGLKRLNADHSMAPVLAELVAQGELTEEAARRDPRRNSLRSVLNGEELALIDASSAPVPFRHDELLLFASDGVESLSTDEITEVLQKGPDHASELADRLINAVDALGRKSQDNTTVIIARQRSTEKASLDAPTAYSEADTVMPSSNKAMANAAAKIAAAPTGKQIARLGIAVISATALLFAIKVLFFQPTSETPGPAEPGEILDTNNVGGTPEPASADQNTEQAPDAPVQAAPGSDQASEPLDQEQAEDETPRGDADTTIAAPEIPSENDPQ